MAQRVIQMGCGYEDGNDANQLRTDPMLKLPSSCTVKHLLKNVTDILCLVAPPVYSTG